MAAETNIICNGAAKVNPFTIAIVSNPVIEDPENSGNFVTDPIVTNKQKFDGVVKYVHDCLFGRLPGQAEQFLAQPEIMPHIRVVSIFTDIMVLNDDNSLVSHFDAYVQPRRSRFVDFLSKFSVTADVAFAVSDSSTHQIPSALYASDDETQGGVPFTLNGVAKTHYFYSMIPGTVALHSTARSLVALHEFSHAISSYRNGQITDLYEDSQYYAVNKRRRSGNGNIPPQFGDYNGSSYASSYDRGGLGYVPPPPSWQTFHCELHAPTRPALMDNFWAALNGPSELCEHDMITRCFLRDRVLAKIARP